MRLAPKCRVWLEKDGRPVFGDGRARLLEAIGRAGSIKGGAAALGMSYRNAWAHVNHIERRIGKELVLRRTGGPHGGGCRLTPFAERLLRTYHEYRRRLNIEMRALWRKMPQKTR
jgi:molybdate transport system regulatory protein